MFRCWAEVDFVLFLLMLLLLLRLAVTTIFGNRFIIAIGITVIATIVQNDNTLLLRFCIDILVQLLN